MLHCLPNKTTDLAYLPSLTEDLICEQTAEVFLGDLPTYAHGVSGSVTAIDNKRLRIEGFNYDGAAPDAHFLAGTGNPSADGFVLLEAPGCGENALGSYSDAVVIVEMPDGYTVADIEWISVWCVQFAVDFGSIQFSDQTMDLAALLAPNTNNIVCAPELPPSCVTLSEDDQLQLSWSIDGSVVHFELAALLDDAQYMSFGISGNPAYPAMIGGDVTVAYMDGEMPMAVDYGLNARNFCTDGWGACQDEAIGGSDDTFAVAGSVVDGVTRISFDRLLDSGDEVDQAYLANEFQQFIWAIGPFSSNVLYHLSRGGANFNLGETRADCVELSPGDDDNDDAAENGWYREPITATTLDFVIGPSGGEQGYAAITGIPSWGIGWYVNGHLIPVLGLTRGVTYTFRVNGGDNPAFPADYHPLYITTDSAGGFSSQGAGDQATLEEGILAGAVTGPACSLQEGPESEAARDSDTFDEYKATLTEPICGAAGEFTWTPDASTPDEVYYQCFTHQYLGWKILVFDDASSDYAVATLGAAARSPSPCSACRAGFGLVSTCEGLIDTVCELCEPNAVSAGGYSACEVCGIGASANEDQSVCEPDPTANPTASPTEAPTASPTQNDCVICDGTRKLLYGDLPCCVY